MWDWTAYGRERPTLVAPHHSLRRSHIPDEPLMQTHLHKPSLIDPPPKKNPTKLGPGQATESLSSNDHSRVPSFHPPHPSLCNSSPPFLNPLWLVQQIPPIAGSWQHGAGGRGRGTGRGGPEHRPDLEGLQSKWRPIFRKHDFK